jgi:uncharacterized protein YeaO (DUF488 family)
MQTANPDPRTLLTEPSPAARSRPKTTGGSIRGEIAIKRAYAPHDLQRDGQRVLVDRLWPRGVSRLQLADAVWLREVAPSTGLRQWFGHKPERWGEFRRRYVAELRSNPAVETLREIIAAGPTTLIYGAKDERRNQAVALAEFLRGKAAPDKARAP